MEQSHTGHYITLIAFVIVMNAVMVWLQSNDAATADASSQAEMITATNDMSTRCGTSVNPEYRYGNDVNGPRPSTNRVMVAEDMRCRQCRGKCKAENLRCRSQCVSESPCLADCDERWSKCETSCKQVFQCE